MEEFVLKFHLVNSCSLSRKHEYNRPGRFSDFSGFAWPSRLVVSGMRLQVFPAQAGTELQQRALFRILTGFPLITRRMQRDSP